MNYLNRHLTLNSRVQRTLSEIAANLNNGAAHFEISERLSYFPADQINTRTPAGGKSLDQRRHFFLVVLQLVCVTGLNHSLKNTK